MENDVCLVEMLLFFKTIHSDESSETFEFIF